MKGHCFYQLCKLLVRCLFYVMGGIRAEGIQNIPARGGALIVSNHISDSDPPALGAVCPRVIRFMAKEELFSIRILGRIIRWLGAFPVKKNTADTASLRTALELLEKGEVVLIFPEGACSETGDLQPFFKGAGLTAKKTDAVVIPACVIGTNKVMPYGKLLPRYARGGIIVRFGEAVSFDDICRDSNSTALITSRLEDSVRKLLAE